MTDIPHWNDSGIEVCAWTAHLAAVAAARAEAVAEHVALVGRVQQSQYLAGQRDAEARWTEIARIDRENARADERARIRRFALGLTTTPETRQFLDALVWHIDAAPQDEGGHAG